jgi:hypothetical protein
VYGVAGNTAAPLRLSKTRAEPPSTKPSTSRRGAAFVDNLRLLLARMEARIPLLPALEPRWLEELGKLRARWSVSDSGEVTEGQVMALVRLRHEVAAQDVLEEGDDEETRVMEFRPDGRLKLKLGAAGNKPTLPRVQVVEAPLAPGQA